jgi:hypothetical protein
MAFNPPSLLSTEGILINVSSGKTFRLIIFLVLVQISYVSLDLAQARTGDENFGIAAGFMMVIFGLSMLCVAVFTWIKKHKILHRDIIFEIVEGLVYISLGIAITISRWELKDKIKSRQDFGS